MSLPEKNLDVLQNLEAVIAGLWRKNPEMTDYVAQRAFEAAFQMYRAEWRGHVPKSPQVTGLDKAAFEAVKEVCEFRLGRSAFEGVEPTAIKPISIEEMIDALRQLIKSVERHTRIDGRQGYVTFIARFV